MTQGEGRTEQVRGFVLEREAFVFCERSSEAPGLPFESIHRRINVCNLQPRQRTCAGGTRNTLLLPLDIIDYGSWSRSCWLSENVAVLVRSFQSTCPCWIIPVRCSVWSGLFFSWGTLKDDRQCACTEWRGPLSALFIYIILWTCGRAPPTRCGLVYCFCFVVVTGTHLGWEGGLMGVYCVLPECIACHFDWSIAVWGFYIKYKRVNPTIPLFFFLS